MEHQDSVHHKLDILLAQNTVIQSKIDKNTDVIKNKIDKKNKEWLDNSEIEEEFRIHKNLRTKLVRLGILRKYRFTGERSKPLYKRSEIVEALEKGVFFPKTKNA